MPNRKLFLHIRDLLHKIYKGASRPDKYLVVTLALMVTGLFLERHVQLWRIALWVPLNIQLHSIVRRFERWVADPNVEMKCASSSSLSVCRNSALLMNFNNQ
jgi:hypothetical protein